MGVLNIVVLDNANFNCPQNSQVVFLTTFNNLHNHVLFPADTENYSSKYRCIPDDVLKEVQFLTEHGNLPITTQRKLLKAKFLTISILDCDLSNAIQKYKTNYYQMPLSLFLVVDNNTKSRLVAQALISDESVESYKWILECTKKVTMTEPLVFVTDADLAM
ncbi:unnamed protein product [Rhizophagus irregularis]|nr:unnamed protein product [Rhizophagus irregularis]